jgi:hypothetical protein
VTERFGPAGAPTLGRSVTAGNGPTAGDRSVVEVEVEVVDVVEGDVGESCGAASAVVEVDLFEAFGDDPSLLLVARACAAGVEEWA